MCIKNVATRLDSIFPNDFEFLLNIFFKIGTITYFTNTFGNKYSNKSGKTEIFANGIKHSHDFYLHSILTDI